MPSQRIPAAPFGGVTSRRHAKLLLHPVESGGGGVVSVKDLRLRRVVPPASAHVDSSPDCAAAKPGSVESTPPEVAAGEDRERKPVPSRFRLVRDPGSFGYRRLLPFLNEMAKNDCCNGVDTPSLDDESVVGNHGGVAPLDSAKPFVLKAATDQEMIDYRDTIKEETKIAPIDLASSRPCLTRCTRSRIVHHPTSFNYKRMLPLLIENEISSQEGHRIKVRRVSEEKQLISDENDALDSEHHHHSPEECNRAEDETIVDEKTSVSDDNCVLICGQLQSAVTEISPPNVSTDQVLKVRQEVEASDGDTLSPHNGELAPDGNNILLGGHRHPAVSEDPPEENNVAEVERIAQENEPKSDENSVFNGRHLWPTISEVCQEGGTQKATQKPAVTSGGGEANRLTSDKGEFPVKEQSQLCDTHELLKDNAPLQQFQSSESGYSNFDLVNPNKIVMVDGGAGQQGSLERHDCVSSLDGVLLDVEMVFRPTDPCDIGTHLSADEMSGCVMHAASRSRKVGTLRPCGAPCSEKQGLSLKKPIPFHGAPRLEKRCQSPKKFSPKRGILKGNTRGCKGICMCLDCSMFRIRADRAFEFSRKQMQEADDIIDNLLKEVANLKSLTEKSSGQEMEATWQRVSRVEEVARERRRHMLMELNSHCRVPAPRVKFSQYVEEKIAAASQQQHQQQ